METISGIKQYVFPAILSVLALGLLKIGLFVTYGDLERSLRHLETTIRSEYATKQDIQDVKVMLTRLDVQLGKINDRLDERWQVDFRKGPEPLYQEGPS